MSLRQWVIKTLKHSPNSNFLDHKKQYVAQCLLATFMVLLLLLTLDFISNELVISSIASTTFIIFAAPHHPLASARYILGGYVVGIVVGLFCFYGLYQPVVLNGWFPGLNYELVGAVAVGASIFFMTLLNFEHPPAAAISLALVSMSWSALSIVMTLGFVILLCLIRDVLAKHLISLI